MSIRPGRAKRRARGRLFLGFLVAAGGTAYALLTIAGHAEPRQVTFGVVAALLGYSLLARSPASVPARPSSAVGRRASANAAAVTLPAPSRHLQAAAAPGASTSPGPAAPAERPLAPVASLTTEALRHVLRVPPMPAARIDPVALGVTDPADRFLSRGETPPLSRAIDVALRGWMSIRGDDGLVVVAGDSRADANAAGWAAVRTCHPFATVLAVEAPEYDASGLYRSQPLAILAELDLDAPDRDLVIWVPDADLHLHCGLTVEELRRLRKQFPEALFVFTLPWDSLEYIARDMPELGRSIWKATNDLRVRQR